MKRFEQISDEDLNKLNKLTVFNCFIIIIFFILFDKNGIFCIQGGREERWPPKFVRHGQVYINLGNVFAECVHFLFSRIREYCREFF
jgi:hypothetical protein